MGFVNLPFMSAFSTHVMIGFLCIYKRKCNMFKKISFFAGSLMLGASLSVYGASFTDQDIQSIESKVGYQFRNKELLKSAFTHMSWANAKGTTTEFDRLEALGDKVLGLCVMKAGYTENPTAAALSQLLDGKVNGKYLAKCYKNFGLNAFLKVEGGTLELGSRKVYEDSMEALIGAAFRDNSMKN
jgi:dsRNA-specific ribonuclease